MPSRPPKRKKPIKAQKPMKLDKPPKRKPNITTKKETNNVEDD